MPFEEAVSHPKPLQNCNLISVLHVKSVACFHSIFAGLEAPGDFSLILKPFKLIYLELLYKLIPKSMPLYLSSSDCECQADPGGF